MVGFSDVFHKNQTGWVQEVRRLLNQYDLYTNSILFYQ